MIKNVDTANITGMMAEYFKESGPMGRETGKAEYYILTGV